MSAPSGSAAGAAEFYIGLMSGTSLDGIDAVLADAAAQPPRVVAHQYRALDPALRIELQALNVSGTDEVDRCARAAQALVREYADAVGALLAAAGLPASAVRAVGAHGQTIRHRPQLGFSVQLNAPALLAELTGIDVVADFRSRDLAAGGQGAPLVPGFHRLAFGGEAPRAVVNIGGISNLTALRADGGLTIGFDCGPGNVLIDAWMERHFHARYDRDGAAAAAHVVDQALVQQLLTDPYFAAPPPKSTGRELFSLDWLQRAPRIERLEAGVVLASLTQLTAAVIAQSIERWFPEAREIVVCGGGARNQTLMRGLNEASRGRLVMTSDALGVSAEHVEALTFAWLARCHVHRQPANLPEVTGARGPRLLGALYPA
jgi:anhydro-N-acetylmuramic acid kinase